MLIFDVFILIFTIVLRWVTVFGAEPGTQAYSA